MKDSESIRWIILLTIVIALGIGGLALYMYIDEVIKGFFIS